MTMWICAAAPRKRPRVVDPQELVALDRQIGGDEGRYGHREVPVGSPRECQRALLAINDPGGSLVPLLGNGDLEHARERKTVIGRWPSAPAELQRRVEREDQGVRKEHSALIQVLPDVLDVAANLFPLVPHQPLVVVATHPADPCDSLDLFGPKREEIEVALGVLTKGESSSLESDCVHDSSAHDSRASR